MGSIRIYGRFLIQEVVGNFDRVEDNKGATENRQRYDIPCGKY